VIRLSNYLTNLFKIMHARLNETDFICFLYWLFSAPTLHDGTNEFTIVYRTGKLFRIKLQNLH